VALMAILLSLVVPNVVAYTNRAKQEDLNSQINVVDRAIRNCYALEGRYPPSGDTGLNYLAVNYKVSIDRTRFNYQYASDNMNRTYTLTITWK